MRPWILLAALAPSLCNACAASSNTPANSAAAPETATAPALVNSGAPRAPGEAVSFPYTETFEGLEPGQTPLGYLPLGDEQATTTVTAPVTTDEAAIRPKSGERMLQLVDDSSQDAAELTLELSANRKGSVQYAFMTPGERAADSYVTIGVGTKSAGRVVDVLFTSGGTVRYRNASGSLVDVTEYSKDEWHDVVVMWDVASTTFFLFLDGEQLGSFPSMQGAAPTNLTFKVGSNDKRGQSAYIDDVQVILE